MSRFLKFLTISLLFCCLLQAEKPASDLPEPYASLEEVLPFNPDGWYSNKKPMEELIKKHKVKIVIEVGSWLGASTRHIATQIPADGVVYAVDHWLGSVEHQGNPALANLYEQFLSNVIHAGLTHKIIPVRMSSLDAARAMHMIRPDLIYLDAGHDTQSVLSDLEAWYPYVRGHGIMCGDDWSWDSVKEAVRIFAKRKGLKIKHTHTFWILTKKK